MIRAGVGYAGGGSAEAVAKEAATKAMERMGADRGDFAFVFATPHYRTSYARLLRAVRGITGVSHLAGCSGSGILTTEGEFENTPGIAVLVVKSRDIAPVSFLVGTDEGRTIRYLVSGSLHLTPLLFVFSDVFSIHPTELIREIEEDATVLPIVGAAASGSPFERRTFQWAGGEVAIHGVAGMLLTGSFTYFLGVAQGCRPIGETYRISRARGHLVLELEGRPAFEVLREVVDTLPPEEADRAASSLLIGLAPLEEGASDTPLLVRNIIGVDPDSGALAVAQQVHPGQLLRFTLRDANAARVDIRRMLEHLYTSLHGVTPRFGFYFNCLGRGTDLYGDPNHDITLIREFFVDLPVIGFFGNAELAPVSGRNYAHNYTGALVLIGE